MKCFLERKAHIRINLMEHNGLLDSRKVSTEAVVHFLFFTISFIVTICVSCLVLTHQLLIGVAVCQLKASFHFYKRGRSVQSVEVFCCCTFLSTRKETFCVVHQGLFTHLHNI